jgi:hypothetical protein
MGNNLDLLKRGIMNMDWNWMSANRLSKVYEDGVNEFVKFAVEHAEHPSKIIFPCTKCGFLKCANAEGLLDHLICYGID